MTFIVIFLILLLQYYFKLAADKPWRQGFWGQAWVMWCKLTSSLKFLSNPSYSAAGFVITAMVGVGLLEHFLGFIAAFVLLWLAIDAFPAPVRSEEISYRFQHLFVIWFWFVVLGIYPAMLYFFIIMVLENIPELATNKYVQQLVALIEWLPARLLGISLGLVSSFMPVFTAWLADWRLGLYPAGPLLEKWINVAVKADSSASLQRILVRVGLLWLVLLAILSIGAYVV